MTLHQYSCRCGRLRGHERALKRLETDSIAIVGVVEELPNLKQEVAARTTEVETKLSMDVGEMKETLTKKLHMAEKELSAKASSADLRKVQLELEEQATREEVQRIQQMVERIQGEAVERIDDLSDLNLTLRADIAEKTEQLEADTVHASPLRTPFPPRHPAPSLPQPPSPSPSLLRLHARCCATGITSQRE